MFYHLIDVELTKPEQLTNEMVFRIGSNYLKRYSIKSFSLTSFLGVHTNHRFASELMNNYPANAHDRWDLLIQIYAKLPNHRGDLALTIFDLFKNAFRTEILYPFNKPYFGDTQELANRMKLYNDAHSYHRPQGPAPNIQEAAQNIFATISTSANNIANIVGIFSNCASQFANKGVWNTVINSFKSTSRK